MADEGQPSESIDASGDQQPAAPTKSRANDQNALFLRAARAGQMEQVLEYLRNGVDINACNSNGLNALHLAAKEGHIEIVRELIRRGARVDAATRKGNTALHIASLAGQDIIVTILVENGANSNAQSLNGFTPLYMAAQENHEVVVRYLLAHGANQALATEDGFTPLAVALQQGHDRIVALLLENDNQSKVKLPALHIAAKKDDTRAATLLLQNDQNPNVTSKSGFTPLHIAAHYGNESIAELLLEKGANINFQARHNIAPLHVAAKWGRVNLVNLLLAKGAIIDCRTRDLLTPLHCAARSGHEGVVEGLLEKGAPISAKTKNGLAPLHMAAQGDHVDCARILLYHRANVDEVTVDYLTPLHVAAHCGHVRVAKLLLDRKADPNARALNGFTPLHIACKKNRIKVVELLLKYHASIEASTESGLSPLHVAAFMGCINIVIFLIQQGANVNCETVRGETPLHLAARANQTDIVRVLVRNKANVDAQARELQTPLHIASRLGNTDIVLILLNANAKVNAATRDLYTPLHIAAKEGQEEVAVCLLDHKADRTLLTKKGFTPLHLACKYGNFELVRLLLERDTPMDIQGKNQVTPLHVAAHYNNEKVAQLLLEQGASAKATAKNGYTPLHIAAKKNQMEIASALLAYRADPNAESRAGFTPLHLAAEEGHREMTALLIERGSAVNAQAKNGLTPMHLCAQEDRVDVASELLRNGAEINAQTKAGYTPLHVACHFGQINMVIFLIENGALVSAETKAKYTPLHQAAQQGHNNVVRFLLDHGASPNTKTSSGQTPLSIAQRLGYVSVVETLRTVTETTVITEYTTETTVAGEERYKPQNPEAMNETMFSDSEDEADDHQAAAQDHARDFNESITQGLRDSAVVHLIHTGEPLKSSPFDTSDADLEAVIRKAQEAPITSAIPDSTFLDNGHDDNVAITRDLIQPSKLTIKNFLISFLVDAKGGAMRGCRHSGVRVIIPPRKAPAPMRITCRYLKKEKLSHPPPLSEGEALASRILEMGPHGAKFLGPVILEVPHFASLRGREREIVILRSDDGQHWKEHQLEATEDAVQEVLNESFDPSELQQLDDLHTSRITRILTNDFPMFYAVVTRVRQEVHCVGPEGGVILSSVVPRVQAIFPDGSLTKTIKVSLQAQPIPHEIVAKLHGNRVAVSPIVTVEPRRRKFHKPITLCIPLPQSPSGQAMLTQYNGQQPGQEPPTLRLLCSITGGSSPAQWEDITGTTQLTFTGEEVSFTTTVSARFWLMDCQTPRDAARMAQEVYNEAVAVPYMAKFVVFARRLFPAEGQLRLFCMTDDKEDKTLEKQEHFTEVAKSRDVEVLSCRHQYLEFAGNVVPITKSGEQLSVYFLPFQENRLAFNFKVRQSDDGDAANAGRIAIMKESRARMETLPPQHPICTLTVTLPDYTGPMPALESHAVANGGIIPKRDEKKIPISVKYQAALATRPADFPEVPIEFVAKKIGQDWARLARCLGIPDSDIRQIKREFGANGGAGQESLAVLKIWAVLSSSNQPLAAGLVQGLRRIGRDDIVHKMNKHDAEGSEAESLRLAESSKFSSKGSLSLVGSATAANRSAAPQPTVPPTSVARERIVAATPPNEPVFSRGRPSQVQQQEEREESPRPMAPGAAAIAAARETAPTGDIYSTEQPLRTVVTRTERYIHESEPVLEAGDLRGEPVADERTITRIYQGGKQLDERVEVRESLPLKPDEQELLWRQGDMSLEERSSLSNSKHAMISEEAHVGDTGNIVHTTTLVTEEMVPPLSGDQSSGPKVGDLEEEEAEGESQQGQSWAGPQGAQEPLLRLSPDYAEEHHVGENVSDSPPPRSGSPELEESPHVAEPDDDGGYSAEHEQSPAAKRGSSLSTDSVIVRDEEESVAMSAPSGTGEAQPASPTMSHESEGSARGRMAQPHQAGARSQHSDGSPSFAVSTSGAGDGGAPQQQAAAGVDVAPVQQKSVVEESYASGDATEVVSKRTIRTVSTSQSSVSGIDEREFPAAASYQPGADVQGEVEAEEEEDEEAPSPPFGSVRERISMFESLKKDSTSSTASSSLPISFGPKPPRSSLTAVEDDAAMEEPTGTDSRRGSELLSRLPARPTPPRAAKEGRASISSQGSGVLERHSNMSSEVPTVEEKLITQEEEQGKTPWRENIPHAVAGAVMMGAAALAEIGKGQKPLESRQTGQTDGQEPSVPRLGAVGEETRMTLEPQGSTGVNQEETASTRSLAGDLQELPHHEVPSDFYTEPEEQRRESNVAREPEEEAKHPAPHMRLAEQEHLPEPILIDGAKPSVAAEPLHELQHHEEFTPDESNRVAEAVPIRIQLATPQPPLIQAGDDEQEECERAELLDGTQPQPSEAQLNSESFTSFDTEATDVTMIPAAPSGQHGSYDNGEENIASRRTMTESPSSEGGTIHSGPTNEEHLHHMTKSIDEHSDSGGIEAGSRQRPSMVRPSKENSNEIVDSEEIPAVDHPESHEVDLPASPVLRHHRESLTEGEESKEKEAQYHRTSPSPVERQSAGELGVEEEDEYVLVQTDPAIPKGVRQDQGVEEMGDYPTSKVGHGRAEELGSFEFVQSEDIGQQLEPTPVASEPLAADTKQPTPRISVDEASHQARRLKVFTPPSTPSMEVGEGEVHLTDERVGQFPNKAELKSFSERVAEELNSRLTGEAMREPAEILEAQASGGEVDESKVTDLVDDVLDSVALRSSMEGETYLPDLGEVPEEPEEDEELPLPVAEESGEVGEDEEEEEEEEKLNNELAEIERNAGKPTSSTPPSAQRAVPTDASSLLSAGLEQPTHISRPKSPVPPRAIFDRGDTRDRLLQDIQTSPEEEKEPAAVKFPLAPSPPPQATKASPTSPSSPASSSLRRGSNGAGSARLSGSGENVSLGGGSLKEFERLEREIRQEQPAGREPSPPPTALETKLVEQSGSFSGSASSLTEFESIEREVREAVAQSVAEDIMMLSDIREESEGEVEGDQQERMSTREDDEEEDAGGVESAVGEPDSLSASPAKGSHGAIRLHTEEFSPLIQDAMLSSLDSLEAVDRIQCRPPVMERSVDSLEGRGGSATSGGGGSGGGGAASSSQPFDSAEHRLAMEADIYNSDERDSLDENVDESAFPTTLTTFETSRLRSDGSREVITRRVVTRVVDPVHSRVKFPGTGEEGQMRDIHEGEPQESVDGDGNVTTVVRQRIPSVVER